MIYLSIVIPAYNEEKRIVETVSKIVDYLAIKNYRWEIILIDDGSKDKTSEMASKTIKGKRLVIIRNQTNSGKGFSVKRGILVSNGKVVLFTDADLSTPIEELDKMLPLIEMGYDIVIGSRALPDSTIKIHQPWYRERMGKIFNLLVRIFILKGFKDTQCGFKCFRRDSALQVFSLQRLKGFAFDVEMLLIAKRLGLRIKEIPVRWINSPNSSVTIFGGAVSMLRELFKIWSYNRKGYYDKPLI